MIEYIIIILLITILFLSVRNKISHFQTIQEAQGCKYIPWGPNFDFCVNNCKSNNRIDLWDETGASCTQDICEQKCLDCENIDMCEWLDVVKLNAKKKLEALNVQETNQNNTLLPKKLNVSGISFGNKVSLTWNNHRDVDKFVIHYYDLSNFSNNIGVIDVDKSEDDVVTHEINTLESNKNYNFVLYGINKYGMSQPSNNINLKT